MEREALLARRGDSAAATIQEGLGKLARHLATQAPPQSYVLYHRVNWRTPAITSPPGFALRASWGRWSGSTIGGFDSFELLTPSGEVWKWDGRHKPGEILDIRGELHKYPSVTIAYTDFGVDLETGAVFAEEWEFESRIRVSVDKVLAQWAFAFEKDGVAVSSVGPLPRVR